MGAGASLDALPSTLDKPTAKRLAGPAFDEKAFDKAAKSGVVSRDDFLKAANKGAGGKAAGPAAGKGKAPAGGGGKAAAGGAKKAVDVLANKGGAAKKGGKGKAGGGLIAKAKADAAASSSSDAPPEEAAAAPAPAEEAAAPEEPPPPPPPPEPELPSGEVMVRYNHYTKKFPMVKGVVKFEDVDAQYAISFVFTGFWACYLTSKDDPDTKITPDGGGLSKEMRPDPDGFNSDDEVEVTFGTFSNLVLEISEGVAQEYHSRRLEPLYYVCVAHGRSCGSSHHTCAFQSRGC